MVHFSTRLAQAIQRCQNPVLVGIDPRVNQLPAGLLADSDRDDPERIADAYRTFGQGIVDVVAPLVAVVKPQAAFFEQLGPCGMSALADVVQYAHQKGLLVILDGKRNDIGSTATAYADAYLGAGEASPWGADALTVSPYLGDDSLEPFVEVAKDRQAGIFVLVKTSNPGGKCFQDLVCDGQPLYRHVAALVEQLAAKNLPAADDEAVSYGAVGAVVGATYPEQLDELRSVMPHSWFLVPGFGAQGGSAADVAGAFDSRGLGAVVNSSRGIIFAHSRAPYDERFGDRRWQEAVEAATRDMIAQLQADTPAGQLAVG